MSINNKKRRLFLVGTFFLPLIITISIIVLTCFFYLGSGDAGATFGDNFLGRAFAHVWASAQRAGGVVGITVAVIVIYYLLLAYNVYFGHVHIFHGQYMKETADKRFGDAHWLIDETNQFSAIELRRFHDQFAPFYTGDDVYSPIFDKQTRSLNRFFLSIFLTKLALKFKKQHLTHYVDVNAGQGQRYGITQAKNPGFVIRFKKVNATEVLFNVKEKVHGMLLGTTGSGKTEKVIIPSVIYNSKLEGTNKPSMVIASGTTDLYAKLSRSLTDNGYDVKLLNLGDLTESHTYNPLDLLYRIKMATLATEGVQKTKYASQLKVQYDYLASTLLPQYQKTGQSWWTDTSQRLFTGLLIVLLEHAEKYPTIMNGERFNLGALAVLFEKQIDLLNFISLEMGQRSDARFYFEPFFGISEKLRYGILSELASMLELFRGAGVRELVCKNEIDVIKFHKQPTAVFIVFPHQAGRINVIGNLLIDQIYGAKDFVKADGNVHGVLPQTHFYFDDFINLPKFQNIQRMLANGRERNTFFLFSMQELKQMVEVYGDETSSVIRTLFNLTIFLNTNSLSTARAISTLLGEKTVIDIGVSKTQQMHAHIHGFFNNHKMHPINLNTSEKVVSLNLMQPQDLMNMDREIGIVIVPKILPSRLKMDIASDVFDFVRSDPADIDSMAKIDFFKDHFYDFGMSSQSDENAKLNDDAARLFTQTPSQQLVGHETSAGVVKRTDVDAEREFTVEKEEDEEPV